MSFQPSCSNIKTPLSSIELEYITKDKTQWHQKSKLNIKYAPAKDSIAIFNGFTPIHDKLIVSAINSLGKNFIALPTPDFEAFARGKIFGNKGQCNPAYFTVGNLIKYLQNLRDKEKIPTKEIIERYFLVTVGGCGPCRFGMYITEYKKALKDAGFDGFRVTNFDHEKGIFQKIDNKLIEFNPKFFITLTKAVIIGDILNIIGYKLRPYEIEKGSTNQALNQCKNIISNAFLDKKSLTIAMYKCQKIIKNIKIDKKQTKPIVMVMGEFWATITEGDGNYNLHKFLELEGAECIPQPLINRLLLNIWEAEYKLNQQKEIAIDTDKTIDFSQAKSKILIRLAKIALLSHFKLYSKVIGLKDYKIANMEYLSKLAKPYYPLDVNGGEGFLEVAHLIEAIQNNLAHLVISIKPFGCMPSSAVSDGIQSLVVNRFPSANFLSIETSGEGSANFYSRVQMALFKAKERVKN